MTFRQIGVALEAAGADRHGEAAFQAKIHGFKIPNGPTLKPTQRKRALTPSQRATIEQAMKRAEQEHAEKARKRKGG